MLRDYRMPADTVIPGWGIPVSETQVGTKSPVNIQPVRAPWHEVDIFIGVDKVIQLERRGPAKKVATWLQDTIRSLRRAELHDGVMMESW